jgi:hypothetical protein
MRVASITQLFFGSKQVTQQTKEERKRSFKRTRIARKKDRTKRNHAWGQGNRRGNEREKM